MDGICPFAEWIDGLTDWTDGGSDRVGFCDHTASGFLSTMRDPGFWNGAGTSVHFAIGRDGAIIQLVNLFDTAFAQGRLGPSVSWPPYNTMGRANPNGYLISTEHEDWEVVNGRSQPVPNAVWTPAQYDADLRVKRWCVEEVRRVQGVDLLRFGIDSLASHHMFDSVNRAECAGRSWREMYREALYADLTGSGTTTEDEEVSNPTWATWADRPANVPYRDYLLFATPSGLKKKLVVNQQEHDAIHNAQIAEDAMALSLADLKAFEGKPEPDDP